MNYVMIYIDDMKQAIPMRAASVDTTTQIVTMEFKIRNQQIVALMKRKGYHHAINAMLYIEYIGIIQIDMKGFYISSFHVGCCSFLHLLPSLSVYPNANMMAHNTLCRNVCVYSTTAS